MPWSIADFYPMGRDWLKLDNFVMTKTQVLSIFAENDSFLKPDQVLNKLRPRPDRRSMYSYLGRLRKQGLLERGPVTRRGQLSYHLTDRGRARLEYFHHLKKHQV